MRRRRMLGWLLTALTEAAASCNGFAASEDRSGRRQRALGNFDQIVIDVAASIVIRAGPPNVVVHSARGASESIESVVRGQELHIKGRRGMAGDDLPLIEVFSPELRVLSLRGSGDVDAADVFGQRLTVNFAGSGNLHLSGLALKHLELRLTGSGTVQATGSSQEQDLVLAGTGSFEGFDLSGTSATIRMPGSGAAEVAVSGQLQVSISGSGSVSYRGSPEVREDITGSGSIEPDPG